MNWRWGIEDASVIYNEIGVDGSEVLLKSCVWSLVDDGVLEMFFCC
jgi:hypothetical protein